jgi:hypothetical protein
MPRPVCWPERSGIASDKQRSQLGLCEDAPVIGEEELCRRGTAEEIGFGGR